VTGLEIVTKALLDINYLAEGETPGPDVANNVRIAANLMLDSWKTNRLASDVLVIQDFNLIDGTQTYTLGAGGTLNATRPEFLPRASIMWYGIPTQPIEIPLRMMTYQLWQTQVPVKAIGSTIPLYLYDDGNFPLRNISLWPYPTSSLAKLRLYLPHNLDTLVLATDYSLPPGYIEALCSNLAVRICPMLKREPSSTLAQIAAVTFAGLKRVNDALSQAELICDRGVLGTPGRWDWRSDTFR
jgi:hypothetical protein